MRTYILAEVLVTPEDFWHVTLCQLLNNYGRFEGRSFSVLDVKQTTRWDIS
jgi:hypothetical protein